MYKSSHFKLILIAVAALAVLAAFGVPVLSNLPLLGILFICPLAMMFMMGGMSHGTSRDDETEDTKHSTHQH